MRVKAFILLFFPLMAWADGPYRAYLKPGTLIKNISTHKSFKLEKGMYAKVLPKDPTRLDFVDIYNQEGMATHEVLARDVVPIEEDLQLLPKVDAQVTYPPINPLTANDESVSLVNQFGLHFDTFQIAPLNPIYSDDVTQASGTRYEMRSLYQADLPVNFGLSINYQNASWSNEVDQIRLSILSLGPLLEKTIDLQDDRTFSLLLGAEYAPIYRTSSGSSVEKYNAVLFDLGMEMSWNTFLGEWTLGGHYRRHNLTLTQSSRANVEVAPRELLLTSVGLMGGYKYEWDWP